MQNEAVLLKKAIMQGIGERYAQELSESKQNAAYSDFRSVMDSLIVVPGLSGMISNCIRRRTYHIACFRHPICHV